MKKQSSLIYTFGILTALAISLHAHAGETLSIKCPDGNIVKVGKAAARNRLCNEPKPQSLLLPAVQSAREAARRAPSARRTNIQARSVPGGAAGGADSSCNGVSSCNDMIATCIALGGNATATSYDDDTGAPDGATCFSPGQ